MPKLAVERVSTAEEVMQELVLGQKVDKLVDQWTKAESEPTARQSSSNCTTR